MLAVSPHKHPLLRPHIPPTLANGDPYVNPGVHVISMRWGKVYALDVSEDSQAVAGAWPNRPKRGSRKLRLPRSKADF
jgi:hypothetical protein